MKKITAYITALLIAACFFACDKTPEVTTDASKTTEITVTETAVITTETAEAGTTETSVTEPPITATEATSEREVTSVSEEVTTAETSTETAETTTAETSDVTIAETEIVTGSVAVTTEEPPVVTEPFDIETAALGEYVRVGNYNGMKVFVSGLVTISDAELYAEIAARIAMLPENAMIYNRACVLGDTVNISFKGLIDGSEFEGGSADAFELVLGTGSMPSGFEEKICGHMPKDAIEFSLIFTEEYGSELAYKEAVYTVTLNYIYPALTDELCKAYFGADSADAYKDALRAELEESANSEIEEEKAIALWTALLSRCRVVDYPKALLAEAKEHVRYEYEVLAEKNGVTYEQLFSEIYDMSSEEADAMIAENAQIAVAEKLVLYAIAQDMGIDTSDAAFADAMLVRAAELGHGNVDSLIASLGISKQEFKEHLLYEKVLANAEAQVEFIADTK